jgi:hypothetical protein
LLFFLFSLIDSCDFSKKRKHVRDFLIHPNFLDLIDPSIASSIEQLISAWLTGSKQSKHFLEEYKSLRKYNPQDWLNVERGQ